MLVYEDLHPIDNEGGKRAPVTPAPEVKLKRVRHDRATLAVAANHGLSRLAFATATRNPTPQLELHLYAVSTGKDLKVTETATVPSVHEEAISVMQFSPDGTVLATGGFDCAVGLWDVTKAGKDWKPRAMIPTGNFTVSCLAFSPDGRTLAAGTYDRKGKPNLFLIDVAAGKIVASHKAGDQLGAVAYSPDGKVLVTGHSGGAIRAWDAAALHGK
jgi:WD40 repeat protein